MYVSRNANSVWALNHCIKILKNEQKKHLSQLAREREGEEEKKKRRKEEGRVQASSTS